MAEILKPFLEEIKIKDKVTFFAGIEIGPTIIKSEDYSSKHASFSEVNFSAISFINVDFSIGLYFEDCTFDGKLVFNNISAKGYDSNLNFHSQSIVFKNCTFKKEVQFFGVDSIIERSVLFESSTFEVGLLVEYMNIGLESLRIRNCTIHKKLDIFNIKAKQDISLSGNNIYPFARLEIITCSSLSISGNNIFYDNLLINGGIFNSSIIFNNGLFKKDVTIYGAYSRDGGLSIIGSDFEKSILIQHNQDTVTIKKGLKSYYFKDSKFGNNIIVGNEQYFCDNPLVEKIELYASPELKGNIIFRNLHVGVIILKGYNSAANIRFENLKINHLKVKGFINNSGLLFSNIIASSKKWIHLVNGSETTRCNAVEIIDSNFGKAQFYQVDFSSFDIIVFQNNILTDISTSQVKWFNPEQLDAEQETKALLMYQEAIKSKDKHRIINQTDFLFLTYSSKQEIYRQLKFASQKQGDIPQFLEFQRHEMNNYRKIVKIKKPRNWSEYLILWSNQSNDFGQNWLKAFACLLAFSFISYLPIGFLASTVLDYSKIASSLSDITLNFKVIFCDNIKTWLILLNPAHRLKDINENIDSFTNWIYFWDILSRIGISYFIFQMISAFRKFNK